MSLRSIGALALAAALVMGATVHVRADVKIEGEPKVAFIYFNVKDDGGWVQAQEEARQKIEATKGWEIPYTEKVEEVASKVRPVVERYIKRGYNIINGSAFGYSDTFLELAAENPNVPLSMRRARPTTARTSSPITREPTKANIFAAWWRAR